MGYGDSPYGTGSYGGSLSAIFTVVSAWAITTHAVRVTLSSSPIAVDQFAAGDALNPQSWSIVDNTTGRVLTVVYASMHDATTVDVTTLEPLGDHLEEHEVTGVGLISTSGLGLTSPTSATFAGVVQTIDPVDRVRLQDFRDRDIANPPFQIARETGVAGTLQYGADGDLNTEAGKPLIRKLVLRRMFTPRGAFKHLPDYGIGLAEKEPITGGGDLQALLREIEDQAKREPDVQTASARGSLSRSNVLIIQLRIVPTSGATIDLSLGSRAGRLVET